MRLTTTLTSIASSLLLVSCAHKSMNPDDPYESFNRKVHGFNMVFDKIVLKPPAKLFKAIVPRPVRRSINNFYENIYLIPTVANDLLQAKWRAASDDSGRFLINSTLGVGGLFDVASNYHLPPHRNDLGLTFAKWGDKKSPYIVIPFLGPSTIRDGMASIFEYTLMTPYPYINNDAVIWGLVGLRYIDLRSQFLDTERLFDEALDKYSFLRDAYLQNRHFLIYGEAAADNAGDSLYVDEDGGGDYIDEGPTPAKEPAPVKKPA